ncbi:hypothetical protein GCM10018781_46580 [Kitasatospora indigofera]|uniref:DUF2695 domain-containing protein n=1 Tax=Kitasatospora indigofera TaxID=67307 RepID=A0A919G0V0_9ACTN|nr:DUF2695 domain-containing protein [Kitasatospora indigofera]GHH76117.1 hypothetical protein GCM10018781_46580 [Kitasatospora indigofera]
MTSERDRRRTLRDSYKAERKRDEWNVLGIDRELLDDLLDHVEERLAVTGCDHTLRHSRTWADSHSVAWSALEAGLQAGGGSCDCEVLANVDPDEKA